VFKLSILAVRKSEKESIKFHVSRLVEAIWMQSDGSAEISLEGMITADEKTKPFDSFDILFSNRVQEVDDVTDSLLIEDLFENKARQSGYKILDRDKRIVEMSGISCQIIRPSGVTLMRSNGYSEIRITFSEPIKPKEVRPFRIVLKIQELAKRTRSFYFGTVSYDFCVSFYDIIRERSGQPRNGLESHKERVVRCDRVHLWMVLPEDAQITRLTPSGYQTVPHDRKGPLSQEVGKDRVAIGWETLALTADPKWSDLRFSGAYKGQSLLSLTTIVAVLGFSVGIVSLLLRLLRI
jgi:hypothetical protein